MNGPVGTYHAMPGGELWCETDDDFAFVARFPSQELAIRAAGRLLADRGMRGSVEEVEGAVIKVRPV